MFIENINGPADVKKLNAEQLVVLAREIRQALLVKLSKRGGHFGPNFGMVEATIAIHYVFESPKDKIVYDVSHQSYPHKMLTGRKDAFLYEDHYTDVSGYSSPYESEHDFFTIGHTSTSISLACGLAKARDLKNEQGNVIAVIGDGSLSGGEALEGLDFAKELQSNLIIVVNDNDMSIAENHGGLYSNLKLLRETNGHIYISCMEIPSKQPEMTTMEFVCRDTGIGMTEEFQKCVFEPFAQEHTGSRTKFAGTGLGMSIAKNLVEKMGGSISFESEEGAGTTFVIRVPFKIDPDADKREEQRDVSEKSIKGLHILLAEDNELNMEIAEFVLQNGGADVTKARNGQEAVELFRKSASGEFDAILMDIMMPVMNGYEAAKKIRSLDREDAKTIPIIAMTANAFMEDRLKAKEAGMNEHIVKPLDVELLIKVIYKLVEC